MFAYENPVLAELLDVWAAGTDPVTLLVPEGRILPQLADWLGMAADRRARPPAWRTRVRMLPFTHQDGYDRLLWACDLNFVRGEDSCVAGAVGGPAAGVAGLSASRGGALRQAGSLVGVPHRIACTPSCTGGCSVLAALERGVRCPRHGECWSGLRSQRAELAAHAVAWQADLAKQPGLADALVELAENKQLSRPDGV
ncbi:MAG: elongation factor P maturation arginine rhamnosyltransferase EarP [Comamonadaceae bacterium]|nr:elongation factor P maturation arginine rhamnosyltransferase EarP [Comamonadaceae bacterium]